MHERIKAHFEELEEAIRTTTVAADRKEAIAGSVKRLSALYAKFRETNDSRYGAEITRLVQGVVNDLAACPEARQLDAAFREKLHLLHEELGVPELILKSAPAPPGPKKTRTKKKPPPRSRKDDDAAAKDPPAEASRVAGPARHTGGPGRASGIGVPIPGGGEDL